MRRRLTLTVYLLVTGQAHPDRLNKPALSMPQTPPTPEQGPVEPLTVLSLNLAQGRKTSLNPLLPSEASFRKNLCEISDFLVSAGAGAIALQEAGAPSTWNGNFNHVTFLGGLADYPPILHTTHARNRFFQYGNALLCKAAFEDKGMKAWAMRHQRGIFKFMRSTGMEWLCATQLMGRLTDLTTKGPRRGTSGPGDAK